MSFVGPVIRCTHTRMSLDFSACWSRQWTCHEAPSIVSRTRTHFQYLRRPPALYQRPPKDERVNRFIRASCGPARVLSVAPAPTVSCIRARLHLVTHEHSQQHPRVFSDASASDLAFLAAPARIFRDIRARIRLAGSNATRFSRCIRARIRLGGMKLFAAPAPARACTPSQ